MDEASAALRISDAAVLIVDVVEGVMLQTEKMIKHIIREGLPIVLVLNKVDRLIVELKLPPVDAYYKLKHVIEEVNSLIRLLFFFFYDSFFFLRFLTFKPLLLCL